MEFTKENTFAVGKIPSGLFIVTAQDHQQHDGYLASFIQQISFSPLLLALAVKPGRPCYDLIKAGKVFTVNVVGKDNNGVMKPFWGAYTPGANAFANLAMQTTESGALILTDCMAAIECKMVSSLTPGDHEIIIAEVLTCHTLKADDQPMTHVRKSGLDY
jgi:flavin reductase (DIM6/NTAB) family NADH-FMN oxidoreductase RutF